MAREAEMLIYSEIGNDPYYGGGISAEAFIKELNSLKDVETINVRINSHGGSVFEGLAIYNALARAKPAIVVHIDGIAASIASVIAMAGRKVKIAANGFIMLHEPEAAVLGFASDIRRMALQLDQITSTLTTIYQIRTGNSEKRIRDWLAAETWFNAAEAETHGFAERAKAPANRVAAAAQLARFRNVPAELNRVIAEAARVERVRFELLNMRDKLDRLGELVNRYDVRIVPGTREEYNTAHAAAGWACSELGIAVPEIYFFETGHPASAPLWGFARTGFPEIYLRAGLSESELMRVAIHETKHTIQPRSMDRDAKEADAEIFTASMLAKWADRVGSHGLRSAGGMVHSEPHVNADHYGGHEFSTPFNS